MSYSLFPTMGLGVQPMGNSEVLGVSSGDSDEGNK